MGTIHQIRINQALAGDQRAVRALIDELSPILQHRIGRVLLRRVAGRSRDVREEMKDLMQQVLLSLFANKGSVLRQWDPERGLSLQNFVGLVAEREVGSILRSRKKSPWMNEEPADLDDRPHMGSGPEQVAASKEILRAVLRDVRAQLTDHGLELFELLIVEERPVEEVCAITGKSADAVYAWRSRLARLAADTAKRILSQTVEGSEQRP